jgi:hypothetical protein
MSTAVTPGTPGAVAAPGTRGGRGARGRRSSVGTLRLLLVSLVVLCLGWGVVATLMVNQHASAASSAVGSNEPLSLDAQQIYQSLADADVTVTTAYLYGSQEPRASKLRYQQDIQPAADDLRTVTADTASAAVSVPLQTLAADLPVYTGYVEDAEIYNSQGLPAGGSYMQVASEEMHLYLLPAANRVYTQENAQLTAASAQATGLPFATIALVLGIVVVVILARTQRWLTRRTHRRLNRGLAGATLAALIALVWIVVAIAAGRSDLLQATQHGSVPAQTLAQADIGALQARGDEALNLISRSGDTDFESNITAIQGTLTTELTSAQSAEGSSTAAGSTAAASHAESQWFAANTQLHTLDAAYQYGQETQLAISPAQDSAATTFGVFTADLGKAITADEATFTANAPAGRDSFTTLEFAVIVLALLMAAGCAWGIDQRLAEYR